MADLESKLLGDRRDNYVSSSEEELDDEDIPMPAEDVMGAGMGPRTGPKGVLEDYKRYKQLEREQRVQQDKERIELIKKLSMTVKTANEDEQEQRLKDEEEAFLQEYHKRRLQQMREEAEQQMLANRPRFGKVFALAGRAFVDAVDNENPQVPVIIHLYEMNITTCIQMNKCFDCLAQQYPYVKFCKVLASEAGLSLKFKLNALPAIQVYRNGILMGNFIQIADELGHEFYAADVENFLLENDVLQSTAYEQVSSNNKLAASEAQDSDSDFDLD